MFEKVSRACLCIQKKRLISLLRLVNISLAGNLPRCVHTENRNTAVDYFHTIKSCDKSDGSAAADIDLTKLSCLEMNFMIVKDSADSCNILSIGIIGSGFSTGT